MANTVQETQSKGITSLLLVFFFWLGWLLVGFTTPFCSKKSEEVKWDQACKQLEQKHLKIAAPVKVVLDLSVDGWSTIL